MPSQLRWKIAPDEFERLRALALANWREMGVKLKDTIEGQRKVTEAHLNRMARIFPNHDFGPWTEAILDFSKIHNLYDVVFVTSYIFIKLMEKEKEREKEREKKRKENEEMQEKSDKLEDCGIVAEWGREYLQIPNYRYAKEKRKEFKENKKNNNNKRRRI
jgi:hypothetical protein